MMMTFINHDTNAVYPTHDDAVKAYNLGNRIDIYTSKDGKSWTFRTFWEV